MEPSGKVALLALAAVVNHPKTKRRFFPASRSVLQRLQLTALGAASFSPYSDLLKRSLASAHYGSIRAALSSSSAPDADGAQWGATARTHAHGLHTSVDAAAADAAAGDTGRQLACSTSLQQDAATQGLTQVVVVAVDPDSRGAIAVASWTTNDLNAPVDISQLEVSGRCGFLCGEGGRGGVGSMCVLSCILYMCS